MKPLTKQQLFDLQVKYSEIVPYNGSGEVIKDWWNDFYAWLNVCINVDLPEDFMREFQEYLTWPTISCHQKLSEDFIWEFRDKVVWNEILKWQKISPEFRLKLIQNGYL